MRTFRLAVPAVAVVLVGCTGSPARSPASLPSFSPSASPAAPPVHLGGERPNIVIFLTDDQAVHLFTAELMPHVFHDLVDQGVNFDRAYLNVSLCCPSRASILTGLYSHDTGVQANNNPLDGQSPLRPTIAPTLQAAGYRTMLDGKYLNSERCDPQPGWTQWVCGSEGNRNLARFDPINPTLDVNGTRQQFTGYTSDILTNFALRFLRGGSSPAHPFFLYLAFHSPHTPSSPSRYDPRFASLPVPEYRPPSFDAQPDQTSLPAWVRRSPLPAARLAQNRLALVKMTQQIPVLDNDIERVLRAIRTQARNTFVVFMTDNGFMYGEHRIIGKVAPYEESVRTPFVIRYPALLAPAQHFTTDALVENVDVAPTLMQLAGIPWHADGISLLPIVARQEQAVRQALLLEHCQANPSDQTCVQGESGGEPPMWGIETPTYVYLEYATGERELYDLQTDPYELSNLAYLGADQGIRQELATELASLRAPPPAPGTTIATGPRSEVGPGAVRFTFFSQARTTTFRCRLTGPGRTGAWAPCDSGSMTFSGLASGRYTFQVQARDAAGHFGPTPAIRRFTVTG